ncbi:hypothetical protein DEU56DRAFT_375318 [Suillus clintonianus]|uniref:uncharacterized protein n=1 Tax=Suillus clintonianus TaxID=1904413 RepID=UPI001B87C7A2|nr:uncharacterized protein DEU56DRAFT_375318 [Suillus clintonianus]KAG2154688.1 hypothetical protein DEU56DRAFT_375318 [Suillus clintonianus]
MAAPPEVTSKNFTGKYIMNKTLSDDSDDILKLQGVSWFKRRAISMFTLTLAVKHYADEAGTEHIDIQQTLSGGIPGTDEDRTLDWEERGESDDVFGAVIGKSKRVKLEEVEDEFLKSGWTEDAIEDGLVLAEDWSDTPKSGMDWRAEMTWGFEILNGERRHARRVKFTSSNKKDGPIFKHLYYDYSRSPPSRHSDLFAHLFPSRTQLIPRTFQR